MECVRTRFHDPLVNETDFQRPPMYFAQVTEAEATETAEILENFHTTSSVLGTCVLCAIHAENSFTILYSRCWNYLCFSLSTLVRTVSDKVCLFSARTFPLCPVLPIRPNSGRRRRRRPQFEEIFYKLPPPPPERAKNLKCRTLFTIKKGTIVRPSASVRPS